MEPTPIAGLLTATLIGAAVGLERQWSGHATGAHARFGGIRTLTLLGAIAGVAGWLGSGPLWQIAIVFLAAASLLIVVGYSAASRVDIDATTEVAALMVVAASTLAGTGRLAVASALAAGTVLLLVEKTRLHELIRRLDDVSLRASARFAAMACIVLPLLPRGPYGPFGAIRPRELWAVVLFLSGLSFLGWIARRLIGPERGVVIAGLLGGIISSTSVTLQFARDSRQPGASGRALAAGALGACTVMLLRVTAVCAVLNPTLAKALLPHTVPPFVLGAVVLLAVWRVSGVAPAPDPAHNSPLQLRAALQMTLMFQAVLLVIAAVRASFGSEALVATSVFVGMTDLDALTMSLAHGSRADGDIGGVAVALVAGIVSNTVVKLALALVVGQGTFRAVTVASLAALAALMTASLWFWDDDVVLASGHAAGYRFIDSRTGQHQTTVRNRWLMQRSHTLIARAGILVAAGTLAAVLSLLPSLQWLSVVVTIAILVVLGWLAAGQAKEAAAQRIGSDALRATNVDLEGRAQAVAASALASSERLRSIIDSAVDGIIVIDHAGHIESFNPAAERLFGYSQSEVAGRNVNMLMPSPYHEEHDGYLRRYLTTGNAKIIGVGREVTGRRRDGSVFPLHLSVGQMTIAGERKFTGILHDLTGRVRLEEQLREQAALARIGEMAAIIAHEVKNPLAGIRGVMQVLGGRAPEGSRDRAVLGDIVKRIDTLDDLMKDLLLFARSPEPRRSSVDIVALVKMTAHLICQDPLLKDVYVTVEGASLPVLADAEMLKIVFQNLFVNAAHAMAGGGRIEVAITTTDSVCQVAVTDTGPGISADIRDKVFTAFFTTKSRGSGLGLATAKRLVEAHQGEIRIECPPRGGTTITVRLPVETAVASAGATSSRAGDAADR